MRCARNRRARGFTLVETLVALTLLAVATGMLIAAQGAVTTLARNTLERETALWLARSRLVEAAAYPDRPPPEDASGDTYEGVAYRTRIEYREVAPVDAVELRDVPRQQRLLELRVLVSWGAQPQSQLQLSAYRKLASAAAASSASSQTPSSAAMNLMGSAKP